MPPVVTFYLILQMQAVNLPLLDDYPAVLGFLNVLIRLHGLRAKVLYILTAQHNEYKLVFEHAIFAAQFYIVGHVNFLVLMALGNSFVLLTLLLLWKVFVVPGAPPGQRVVLFAPVVYLFVQLHYAETLDWSMAALQNIPVIFFALLSIALLARNKMATFPWALIAFACSVASSGNGFLVAPIGAAMLLQNRRYRLLVPWCMTVIAVTAGYFYHYNFSASQTPRDASVLDSFRHIHLLYAFSFLGSALAGLRYLLASVICLCFVAALRARYRFTNPAVFYSMVWILLTAAGLSGIRSGFGVQQSLSARYTIYSDLLLLFCYMFLTEVFWSRPKFRGYRMAAFTSILLLSVALAVWGDLDGYQLLSTRKAQIVQGMGPWRNASHNEPAPGSGILLSGPPIAAFYDTAQKILTQSSELGVYRVPEP